MRKIVTCSALIISCAILVPGLAANKTRQMFIIRIREP